MKSFSIKTWNKIGVEVIKYNGKKWINENNLETALGYYFPKYKLAAEIDESGNADRYSVKENKRQTEITKYLHCKFIRINPDKKDFSAYDALGEIYKFLGEFKKRKIKNLEEENEDLRKEKNSLIDKISKRLLELKFVKHKNWEKTWNNILFRV